MRVAGFGFRQGASAASLAAALQAAGGPAGRGAVACLNEKCGAPALQQLAATLGVRVLGISREALARQATVTRSARIARLFGTGSLAEAAALAAAGANARLLAPRAVSADGMATAAIAEGDGT